MILASSFLSFLLSQHVTIKFQAMRENEDNRSTGETWEDHLLLPSCCFTKQFPPTTQSCCWFSSFSHIVKANLWYSIKQNDARTRKRYFINTEYSQQKQPSYSSNKDQILSWHTKSIFHYLLPLVDILSPLLFSFFVLSNRICDTPMNYLL